MLNTPIQYSCHQLPTPTNSPQLLQQITSMNYALKLTAAVAAIHVGG